MIAGTEWDTAVMRVLDKWLGTPYRLYECTPGPNGGVDCVRHGFSGFLDSMYGYARTPPERLPPDAALHAPASARAAMKRMMRLYPNHTEATGAWQAGDLLVTRNSERGGPGHLVIATAIPGVFQEATTDGVRRVGMFGLRWLIKAYRITDKHRWQK